MPPPAAPAALKSKALHPPRKASRNAASGCTATSRTSRSSRPVATPAAPNSRRATAAPPPSPAPGRRRKYKLPILEHNIQDNSANATRFVVIGRKCPPPTGRDRTSVMFSIVDKIGALHSALAPFRRHKLNMIQDRIAPASGRPGSISSLSISTATCTSAKSPTPSSSCMTIATS